MPSNNLFFFLGHFTTVLSVAACLVALIRFRQLSPTLRYLALLACFDALMELTASALKNVLHVKSNLFLFPMVLTGEISFLVLLYRQELQSRSFTRVAPWLMGLFAIYAFGDQLVWHATAYFAPGVQVVSNLLILALVVLYFRKLLNDLQVEQLTHEPLFWLSVGLTIYALGNLLIMLFSDYILAHCSQNLQILILLGVRNLFNIQLYAAYCLALWMRPQKQSLSAS